MSTELLLVLAVIVVMGWFALGVIYNLRYGNGLLRWMQGGLPLIGEKTTLRWLGTSVAELVIAHARRPFQQVTVMVVLAPRDVPWFWLLAALNRRRDLVIFRAHLASAPWQEFELVDPTSWTGRIAIKDGLHKGWEIQPYQRWRLLAPAGQLEPASQALGEIEPDLQAFSSSLLRCAVHSAAPHLEVHVLPPKPKYQEAETYFRALQKLAQAAGRYAGSARR